MAYCGLGRGVHQIGFVETVRGRAFRVAVLHQNLRSLRQTGQQFVRGLRGENHCSFARRTVATDGVHVLVEIVEGGMRPATLRQSAAWSILRRPATASAFHVIQHTVVSALRNGQHARFAFFGP